MTRRPIGSRTWAFHRTHYWTPKIQDGLYPPSWKSTWRHLFCWGWSDLDKISQTGAEWRVDCGDMVQIEIRCRIPIWRTFGRIPWHVIPESRITLQGAATWWIYCHDSRATCHIAECRLSNSIRHIENVFSPLYFVNAVWALTSGGFRIVSDTFGWFRSYFLRINPTNTVVCACRRSLT